MVKVPPGGHFAKSLKIKPKVSVMIKTIKDVEPKPDRKIKVPGSYTNTLSTDSVKPKNPNNGERKSFDENKYITVLERRTDIDRVYAMSLIRDLKEKSLSPSSHLLDSYKGAVDILIGVQTIDTGVFRDLLSDLKAWFFQNKTWEEHFYIIRDQRTKVGNNLLSLNQLKTMVRDINKKFDFTHKFLAIVLHTEEDNDENLYNFLRADQNTLALLRLKIAELQVKVDAAYGLNLNLEKVIQDILMLIQELKENETKALKQKLINALAPVNQ